MLGARIKHIFSKKIKNKSVELCQGIVTRERVEEHSFIVGNGFIDKRLVDFIEQMY